MKHEYMRRIEIALDDMVIDQGSAALAEILHDDDCAYFSGVYCNCDPEITIHTQTGDVNIMSDGSLWCKELKL